MRGLLAEREALGGGDVVGVELREAESLELVALLTGHTDRVNSVSFSPDGKVLASGSGDWTVLLWDVEAVLGTR